MGWFRQLIELWRRPGHSGIRRVIVLVIEGLEPARVDHVLEHGLLHNLALLSDVGTRAASVNSRPLDAGSLAASIRSFGARTVVLLPPRESTLADLTALCEADRAQQERLIAALSGSRPGVVLCVFNMPARLQMLFGPEPDASQRQVIRDVYARMDEVVGKAFSFADEGTVLLVQIPGENVGELTSASAPAGMLFSSSKLDAVGPPDTALQSVVLDLLGLASSKS